MISTGRNAQAHEEHMSNLARREELAPPQDSEWAALFGQGGSGAGLALGTARWMAPGAAIERFGFPQADFGGRVFLGEGFDWKRSSLGYADDRHVCLVSGSRGGKGVGVIVPNLVHLAGLLHRRGSQRGERDGYRAPARRGLRICNRARAEGLCPRSLR